jgi:hypothetical protein
LKNLSFIVIIIASVTSASADEAIIKGPNGLSILCSQWSKQGGFWKSSKDATLIYPNNPGSFVGMTVGPGILINGVDLAAFLNENSGK